MTQSENKRRSKFILLLALGFGIGRAKVAPGTFGTLLGFVWFAALLAFESIWVFSGGTIAGVLGSVWICGKAEEILGEHDPGCIVLDEIVAVPICFVAWTLQFLLLNNHMPSMNDFRSGPAMLGLLGMFVLFRVFDIWKPWPAKQSQSLPRGWGVTADDVVAAVYVNLVTLLFIA